MYNTSAVTRRGIEFRITLIGGVNSRRQLRSILGYATDDDDDDDVYYCVANRMIRIVKQSAKAPVNCTL